MTISTPAFSSSLWVLFFPALCVLSRQRVPSIPFGCLIDKISGYLPVCNPIERTVDGFFGFRQSFYNHTFNIIVGAEDMADVKRINNEHIVMVLIM